MKNKNKVNEGALDTGIQSYPTSSVQGSTSNTGAVKKPTVNVKQDKLNKVVPQLKGDDVNINIVGEDTTMKPKKLSYLSDILDENNEVSKPFNLNGKNYQIVRALTQENEKVMGVYSLDEMDEFGENRIHDISEFEKSIDNKQPTSEEGVVEPEGPQADVLKPTAEPTENAQSNPNFVGFKHFIVNKKTGKARKFKDISELAKAQMGDDEQYMGVRDFKKYVDEALFGANKRQPQPQAQAMSEEQQINGQENDEQMALKAEQLMDMIKKKLPAGILETITTPVAQREVIAAFAEMVGVKRNDLVKVVATLKDLNAKPANNIQENRKVIKTIKIKDLA